MSRQVLMNIVASVLIAGAVGTAGCAMQVAMAAADTVLQHEKALPRIELELKEVKARLERHATTDAAETAKIRADVAATREGVARIEGRLGNADS